MDIGSKNDDKYLKVGQNNSGSCKLASRSTTKGLGIEAMVFLVCQCERLAVEGQTHDDLGLVHALGQPVVDCVVLQKEKNIQDLVMNIINKQHVPR